MSTIKHYLIAGLGNITHPGTRHSIGHLLIDSLASRFGVRMTYNDGILCWEGTREIDIEPNGGSTVRFTFVKPKPLMNISGPAVVKAFRKHINPQTSSRLIIIHDSLSHRPLQVSPKAGGSAEGHNGVRSIMSSLGGDTKFPRIRAGIGKGTGDIATYVLGRLSAEEKGFWQVEGQDRVWKEIEIIVSKP